MKLYLQGIDDFMRNDGYEVIQENGGGLGLGNSKINYINYEKKARFKVDTHKWDKKKCISKFKK